MGTSASWFECIVFPSLCPTLARRSWRALPEASVVSASVWFVFFPFRPMSSGNCATWISGKAPPSQKSARVRGTQPLRLPWGGARGVGAARGSELLDSSSTSSTCRGAGRISGSAVAIVWGQAAGAKRAMLRGGVETVNKKKKVPS